MTTPLKRKRPGVQTRGSDRRTPAGHRRGGLRDFHMAGAVAVATDSGLGMLVKVRNCGSGMSLRRSSLQAWRP